VVAKKRVRNAIRDNAKTSRKGRKPANGIAMSAAERKRLQRQREKERKVDLSTLPSWLRYRHRMIGLLQDAVPFADVNELANALSATAQLLVYINCAMAKSNKPGAAREEYWPVVMAYLDPDKFHDMSNPVFHHLDTLAPYVSLWADSEYASCKSHSLCEVICDMFDCHELPSDEESDAESTN
jgi:hypothetical protein